MTSQNVDLRHFYGKKVTAMYHTWEFFRLLLMECPMTFPKYRFSTSPQRDVYGNMLQFEPYRYFDFWHLYCETITTTYRTWEFFRLQMNFAEYSMTYLNVDFLVQDRTPITLQCLHPPQTICFNPQNNESVDLAVAKKNERIQTNRIIDGLNITRSQ